MQLGRDEYPRDRGNTGKDGYVIRPVQLDLEPMDIQSDTDYPMLDPNVNAWMDEGFHCGMTQAADGADAHFGRCFHCLEEGHRWRECKNTQLLPELQEILDTKQEGGHWKQGRPHPHEPQEWQGQSRHPDQARTVKLESKDTPFHFWNQDTLSCWLGPENLGWALVEGIQTRVLLDNGA